LKMDFLTFSPLENGLFDISPLENWFSRGPLEIG